MRQKLVNSPIPSGLVFIGSMMAAFMATKSHATLPLLAIGLPALHGALTAKSALQSPPSTPTNPRNITLELVCAGMLGLAFGVALIGRETVFGLLLGWSIAAIATLVLVVSTALNLRRWQPPGPPKGTKTRLALQICALVVYGLLVLWMASVMMLWLALWLSGEPYMGN